MTRIGHRRPVLEQGSDRSRFDRLYILWPLQNFYVIFSKVLKIDLYEVSIWDVTIGKTPQTWMI